MVTLEKIRDYLLENTSAKVKDIAKNLGCTRKAVNSILYYNSTVFIKDLANKWSLKKNTENLLFNQEDEVKPAVHEPENTIIIDDIDIVERIKDVLKQYDHLKVRDIAEQLEESRIIIARTLNSFQGVFEKDKNNEWSNRPEYIDVQTDEFSGSEELKDVVSNNEERPTTDFNEGSKSPQKAVIEATLDRNFLVLAPPGTGKTHTLIERLVYVISKSFNEIDAGELLVLSFTRAAVGEIRERIANAIANGAPLSLRYVRVRTFDSYATWLLNDGGYDIAGKTYDARISLLTDLLRTASLKQATDRIGRSRYLFVDEIQDLVGARADMVFELVKRVLASNGSVTLLGDPHQSLNDYQVQCDQTDSTEFLEKVKSHLANGLERFELEESYRYETSSMKILAVKAKKILDNDELGAKDKLDKLVELIPEITLNQLIKNFKNNSIDALLCRSNGEVYQWYNWHQKEGNQCTVNAGSISRPWPPWIGQALMHYQPAVITRRQLLNRLSSNKAVGLAPSEEEVDIFLRNERLYRRNAINLEDLAFRLKYLSPALKGVETDKGLIISTVHKAKGLEYKNVTTIRPSRKDVTDEEVRVLYVAVTRAKCSITLLPNTAIPFSGRIKKKRGGHLGYTENDIKYLQVIGLEDFDLETLFINDQGGVDINNLENYQLTYQEENHYSIRPESCNAENDHNYALYLISTVGPVKVCAVGEKMKSSLDAMSWGNEYGKDGCQLNIGKGCNFQTIVHPLKSPVLARYIGPAGIMVFPLIEGFYSLIRATGE